MKNVVKDIKLNCEDHSPEGIVKFLMGRGDLAYTSDYHREVYFFYIEARKLPLTHRDAKQTTMQLFKISSPTFKRILKRFTIMSPLP